MEGALTTDELGLDDGNPVAPVGQAPRQHLAGRASADHDHVNVRVLNTAPLETLSMHDGR